MGGWQTQVPEEPLFCHGGRPFDDHFRKPVVTWRSLVMILSSWMVVSELLFLQGFDPPKTFNPFWNYQSWHGFRISAYHLCLPSFLDVCIYMHIYSMNISPLPLPFQVYNAYPPEKGQNAVKWSNMSTINIGFFLWSLTTNTTSISEVKHEHRSTETPLYQQVSSPNHVRKMSSTSQSSCGVVAAHCMDDSPIFRANLWSPEEKRHSILSKDVGTFTNFIVPWGQGVPWT